jgi:two-component system CheB/CheR fusion protein
MDSQPARPPCVLVVDDNRDTTDSVCHMLSLWGYRPLAACDAAAALAMAVAERPDVALLDIGLPGLNGWELARRLRAEPDLEGIVLLAVTGYGQAVDRDKSLAAGFDNHLLKPVEPELLQQLLATLCANKGQPGPSPSLPPLPRGRTR